MDWRKVLSFEAEDEPTTTERVVHYPANHPSSQVQRLVKRDVGAALKDTGVNLVSLRGPMHSGSETTWVATLSGPVDVLGMMPESIFVFTGAK